MSNSSHDEAVEAFMEAEEPITVEVLRRNGKDKGKADDADADAEAEADADAKSVNSAKSESASSASSSCARRRASPHNSSSASIAVQTDLVWGATDCDRSVWRRQSKDNFNINQIAHAYFFYRLSVTRFLEDLSNEELCEDEEDEEDLLMLPDLDYEVRRSLDLPEGGGLEEEEEEELIGFACGALLPPPPPFSCPNIFFLSVFPTSQRFA